MSTAQNISLKGLLRRYQAALLVILAVAAGLAVAPMGQVDTQPGVRLRWPDGEVTTVLAGPVTGLGAAAPAHTAGGSHA